MPDTAAIHQGARVRRSTTVALAVAVIVLTSVAVMQTLHLHRQASLSEQIRVDWISWFAALALAYAGLGLVGWWAVARDRSESV